MNTTPTPGGQPLASTPKPPGGLPELPPDALARLRPMALDAMDNLVRVMESQTGQPVELLAAAITLILPDLKMSQSQLDCAFACAIAELAVRPKVANIDPKEESL